jgi:signal peptidase II
MRRHLVFLIVPVIFLLDRWTKLLIIDGLPFARHIDVTSFFSIVHARNYGGAFSLLSQHIYAKYIFTVIPILVAGMLIFAIFTYKTEFSKRLSLTCILSGAVGNIYDRISYGYVVDFLDVYYKDYHWPAFNVADISISSGICLWIFVEIFQARRKVKNEKKVQF